MKAVIATNNEVKVQGAQKALEHYFDEVEVIGVNVKSDISDQPVNEEICIGAKNRIFNLKQYCNKNNIKADLYLAIESGLSNKLGEWQVISIAIIEDNDGISGLSTTTGFQIPERYVDDVINNGVQYVMNKIFGNNTKQKGIELLTNGVVNRTDWTEQAFIMALIKIIHKGKWE